MNGPTIESMDRDAARADDAHDKETFRQMDDERERRNREFIANTRLEARDALRHIIAMHDAHPETVMPSPLLAAIEAGRLVL